MVWSNRVATWGSSRTSTGWKWALPPSLRIVAADFSPRSCWMSARITVAPSAAAWRAQAKPMPWAAPVTRITLFWRRLDMGQEVDSLRLKAKPKDRKPQEFNTEGTESTEEHGEKLRQKKITQRG